MITYVPGGFNHFRNIFRLHGSVFGFAAQVAAPASLISLVAKYFVQSGYLTAESKFLLSNAPWVGFAFLVGWLIVFRTSQCYSRFWGATTCATEMRRQWYDAASNLVAFTYNSQLPPDEIFRFKHLIVRLFSIFHAVALAELVNDLHMDMHTMKSLRLIDPDGLDARSLEVLQKTQCKVGTVFQWIQVVVVDHIKTGELNIPPPILSRVFQQVSDGMVAFHDAKKVAYIPFPFPYIQTCNYLLVFHWILTPMIVASWTASPWWAFVFSFVMVFTFWSLLLIADELENPFGTDSNDLNFEEMQMEMNQHLLCLLAPMAVNTPALPAEVILSTESLVELESKGHTRSFLDVWRDFAADAIGTRFSKGCPNVNGSKEVPPPECGKELSLPIVQGTSVEDTASPTTLAECVDKELSPLSAPMDSNGPGDATPPTVEAERAKGKETMLVTETTKYVLDEESEEKEKEPELADKATECVDKEPTVPPDVDSKENVVDRITHEFEPPSMPTVIVPPQTLPTKVWTQC
mmetsp:Transcript_77118/g.174430  ORF Transcript_77118/g.174430 Transcript_77118/m.174430 type:complete len:520 (-) Transcript_77118:101-1660(-)